MSYSSCGEAVGGSVANCAAGAPVLRGGGGNCDTGCDAGCEVCTGLAFSIGEAGGAIGLPESALRSSGAPAARPPGAPTGGSLAALWPGDAIIASLPRTRGAPGAFGRCEG